MQSTAPTSAFITILRDEQIDPGLLIGNACVSVIAAAGERKRARGGEIGDASIGCYQRATTSRRVALHVRDVH